MDFELSSEQKLLRDTVRTFTKQKSPIERFRRVREERRSFDADVWAHMGELGWLSVPFPEDTGGFGGDFFDVAIILEGLGKTLVPEPYIPSVVLGGMAILEAGDAGQHERWLTPMMDGKSTLALAYAERGQRFDVNAPGTLATSTGDGWKLRGRKEFVLAGHRADQLVVSATVDGELGLFVIDPGDPGVTISELRTIDGHGAATVALDVTVAPDRRLAAARATEVLPRILDYGAAAACAEAVGVCQRTLDLTLEHLKTREQFGVAIGTFQVLQHAAVDMFVHVQLMRSMSTLAAGSAKLPDAEARAQAISAAKAHIGTSGRFVAQTAIQLHGGIGITDEHDVGLYFKRMQALGTLFGDEHHHVARFAALPGFAEGSYDPSPRGVTIGDSSHLWRTSGRVRAQPIVEPLALRGPKNTRFCPRVARGHSSRCSGLGDRNRNFGGVRTRSSYRGFRRKFPVRQVALHTRVADVADSGRKRPTKMQSATLNSRKECDLPDRMDTVGSMRWLGLAVCVLAIAGCRGGRSTSPDPCANGECETNSCDLGLCNDEDPFAGRTISSFSPSAGAFSETESATCPLLEGEELPPLETYLADGETIPEFDRRRGRHSNVHRGQAFLQDHELHEHLLGVQGALFECLDVAACYSEEVIANTGALDFEFWLEPDGTVSAVSVKPTEELDQPVIRACARKSVYNARFPPWNGGGMVVSYSVEFSDA